MKNKLDTLTSKRVSKEQGFLTEKKKKKEHEQNYGGMTEQDLLGKWCLEGIVNSYVMKPERQLELVCHHAIVFRWAVDSGFKCTNLKAN